MSIDDNAMNYEYLIRRAHQCGRHGVAGADADTFRRLQRLAYTYIEEKKAIETKGERKWRKSEEEMLTEYMISAGEVSAYIKTATQIVKKNYYDKLTDDQYNELEDIEVSLIKPDIEIINEAVKRAEKVMLDIGLYPK